MNNDLISRSALIEDFRRIARAQANARVFEAANAWEGAADRLAIAPAVDAAPVRHGRWKRIDSSVYKPAICSCCGASQFIDSNYCPNCGAKMDGGAEK